METLCGRPLDRVAYKLINEPVADGPADGNRLVAKAVAVVRTKQPWRVIVVGSNRGQLVDNFDQLEVPANGSNPIPSLHFDEPFLLTLHKADLTSIGAHKRSVEYPGRTVPNEEIKGIAEPLKLQITQSNSVWDRARITLKLAEPLALAQRTGLHHAQWARLDTVPRASRLNWNRDRYLRAHRKRGGLCELGLQWRIRFAPRHRSA